MTKNNPPKDTTGFDVQPFMNAASCDERLTFDKSQVRELAHLRKRVTAQLLDDNNKLLHAHSELTHFYVDKIGGAKRKIFSGPHQITPEMAARDDVERISRAVCKPDVDVIMHQAKYEQGTNFRIEKVTQAQELRRTLAKAIVATHDEQIAEARSALREFYNGAGDIMIGKTKISAAQAEKNDFRQLAEAVKNYSTVSAAQARLSR